MMLWLNLIHLLLEHDSSLQFVNKFCYLDDILGEAGVCLESSMTRIKCAWASVKRLCQYLLEGVYL